MENKLLTYFSSFATLSQEERSVLLSSIEADTRQYSNETFLLNGGNRNTSSGFVFDGIHVI